MNRLAGNLSRKRGGRRPTRGFARKLAVESLENRLLLTVVSLEPLKDNTIYEVPPGTTELSSGAGENLLVGRTGQATNDIRRGLLAFDVAGNVPAGATISSATLTLTLERAPPGNFPVTLHGLSADWGEGTSDADGGSGAGSGGGDGAPATPGDATWFQNFFGTSAWGTAGGVFDPAASATITVGPAGSYTWGSTSSMVANVQSWLDDPTNNFGWLVKGDEVSETSSKRFKAREAAEANRPLLTIDFTLEEPDVLIADAAATEGDSGTTSIQFEVTLSEPSTETVTVNFTTVGGTAVEGVDYVGLAGQVTFAPQDTSEPITITVHGDQTVELDETFLVRLSDAVGATVLDSEGHGTITNDDSATLSINDVTLEEGNTGTTDFTFTVTLDADVDTGASVNFDTADDTATSADGDYTVTSGTLNFAGNAGETRPITVSVGGDGKVELDETFLVNLSTIVAGGRDVTLGDGQGQGTITNDDGPIDLGAVDFLELPGRDPSSGDIHYSLTTVSAGFLTVEAMFSGPPDSVTLSLRDSAGSLLIDSSVVDGKQRLDWQAASGEAFVLDLSGTAGDVDLRLINLLDHTGSIVTIHGTAGPDTIDFNAQNSRDITVNGVLYAFADADLDTVNIEMGLGNDLLDIQGSPLSEELIVGPREGDGVQTATFAVTDPAASDPFTLTATGFEQLRAWSRTGDPDTATFHDSPSADKLKANGEEDFLVLRRKQGFAAFFRRAKLFEEVNVIADVASKNDLTIMVDSSGDDQFTADAEVGSYELSGADYVFRVETSGNVVVRSEFGGTDSASFTDSSENDKFVGNPNKGRLFSLVVPFDITVRRFDNYEMDFPNGGIDKVRLTDSGQNDHFVGRPNESTFQTRGVNFTARQAEQVFVFSELRDGETDTAELFDTNGNDLLEADGSSAKLSADRDSLELLYEVIAFEQVRAVSSTGTDNVEAAAIDFLLTLDGNWQN